MLVVAVEPEPPLSVGTPRLLFEGDYMPELASQGAHEYDVAGDGQRFIMLAPAAEGEREEARPRVILVQNWHEELKRLVPVD